MIAPVALARTGVVLGLLVTVGSQGPAHIDLLLELAIVIAADVAFRT